MPDINITFAERDAVDSPELRPYVDQLLRAIDHPEALVTDESSLYDFGCFSDTIERQLIEAVRHELGIQVSVNETLVSIARQLRDRAMRS